MIEQSKQVLVIRKKIKIRKDQSNEEYEQAFRNEQWCLVLLNRLKHPNIVPLLASYSYGGEHNLLFPAFDMDLGNFLERKNLFGQFEMTITFYSALDGLASALRHTHRLHLERERHGVDFDAIGYHHDLRPANVLVSSETFILADFGLGKFKPADLPSQTRWKAGIGDYLAPECMDENFLHQDVGRAIDVWAFGCLVIEVITYMEEGVSSLELFRQSRLSQGRHAQWSDRYFFNGDAIIKPEVQNWLTRLTKGALTASPLAMLGRLAGKALKRDPQDRPKMADFCLELTFISLKAHFLAVCSLFQEYVEPSIHLKDHASPRMKLWFERERFITFGHILGLHGDYATLLLAQELAHLQNDIRKVMTSLYLELKNNGHQTKKDPNGDSENTSDCSFHVQTLEIRIHESVGLLWNYLPAKEQRTGEASWLRLMLNSSEPGYLDGIHRSFKLEDDPAYEKGAAMAMMKRIRLEMESNPTEFPENSILSQDDVQVGKSARGHTLGLFKMTTPVLVEWMYYSPAWKAIPVRERKIVMGLKAQGFGVKPKPPGLRTLHCIGTFESAGKKEGYGFIYRIPGLEDGTESTSSITTLLQLLESPQIDTRKVQYPPTLRERFGLASMLAGFLEQFHCIGWLHKDFNSNNILFTKPAPEGDENKDFAQILEQPYVVGLNKSRPDGEAWHTQGLSSGESLQEYQHPEYARTGRYHVVYDYYSFGLILLEIGFWRPLSYWSMKHQTVNLADLRQTLLTKYVPRLGAQMGAIYREVTRFCLSIDSKDIRTNAAPSKEESNEGGTDGLALIIENVIEPLEGLARMAI